MFLWRTVLNGGNFLGPRAIGSAVSRTRVAWISTRCNRTQPRVTRFSTMWTYVARPRVTRFSTV